MGTVHPEVAVRAALTAKVATKRRNTGCEVIDHMSSPLLGGSHMSLLSQNGNEGLASGHSLAIHSLGTFGFAFDQWPAKGRGHR
ncbi:hypothetical protein GCM10009566_48530 [Streptomyces murinus]